MTPLARHIARRIATEGPIGIADYMAECLLHPEHGYYTQAEPFGTGGDFTTAPEISQMFGELLGLCLAQAWLDQGAPAPFVLAETGPGRGTLMADLLRATRGVPGFHAGLRLWLVEASPRLRERQAATLEGYAPHFSDDMAGLPDGPLFLVANEFFDALPIRQFQRGKGACWHERQVAADAEGRLAPALGPGIALAALEGRLDDTRPGDVVETCPALDGIAGQIAGRIAGRGGAAVIVDYGGWHSLGDTLQAVRAHRPDDPFAHPGQADLTAHVDFEALARAGHAAGAAVAGPVAQGALLGRLGIAARAERLARGLGGAARESHLAAYRRLTDPAEMGTLFKAIAFHPPDGPCPPGFGPEPELP